MTKSQIFFLGLLIILTQACSTGSSDGWERNTLHGVSLETPGELQEIKAQLPAESMQNIKTYNTYLLEKGSLAVFFLAVDSNFPGYDKKVGLSNSVGNMITALKGTDLKLEYTEPQNKLDDLACTGTFILDGIQRNISSYVYWDGKGKFYILTTFGKAEDVEAINRIQKSFEL